MKPTIRFFLIFTSLTWIAACSSNSPPPLPTADGSMHISILGLPTGVDADVTIANPSGAVQTVTTTQLLTQLSPGDYHLVARPVSKDGSTHNPTSATASITVVPGATASVAVNYETVRGTLQIIILGLPAGASANVVVNGPNGFSERPTSSGVFNDVLPGTYVVAVSGVIAGPYSYSGAIGNPSPTVTSNSTTDVVVNYVASTGALQISVNGLPNGVAAELAVTGPGGYHLSLGTSTTVPLLAPGTYDIVAEDVRVSAPTVDQTYLAPAISAAVTAGSTSVVSANHSLKPGTGKLWIGSNDGLLGFDASQLAESGSPTPSVVLRPGHYSPAIAFDRNGNLWNSNGYDFSEFSWAQLAVSGSPLPNLQFNPMPPQYLAAFAFDSTGSLWMSEQYNNKLAQYTPAQLAVSGSPTPNVWIGDGDQPWGLAFDSGHNLWVANYWSDTLVKFTPDQLTASGTPTPAVIISVYYPYLSGPTGLAFDAAGNLWVANMVNTIAKFTPDQLAVSGHPLPEVMITAVDGSLSGPNCLAFDNGGNLWVVNLFGTSNIVKFTTSQLTSSGSPTPAVVIRGINAPGGCAFDPAPLNLPLSH